jgi:hypothetical protein
LLKESEQQYEILKYESFNYFKGSFTEALDSLKLPHMFKKFDQYFILPLVNLSNVIS